VDQMPPASKPLNSRTKVVAGIPCFNEELSIGSVIVKARKFVDKVIVIDDGSTDATAEVAADAGAEVYQHSENQGYGAAVCSAMARGRELGADVLVVLDGDGQHNPNDIPNLVKPLLDGRADIVVGSRFLKKGRRPPLYRRLGQRILTAATNLGSGHRSTDSQSGFRAYSAKALTELCLAESGMSISSEMQFAIRGSGLRVTEVPIDVSYRGKPKRNPLGHGLSVLSRVLVLIALRQPLLLFGVPGLGLLAGGLALGARVLAAYGNTRELAMGNALVTILLCLAGLLALFAALMLQAMKELLRGGVAQPPKEAQRYRADPEPSEGGGGPN
jgi:glycosyltransferase involved in cell wall biosynthesis